MFYKDDGTTMQDYQTTFPGTTSINKTADGTLEVLDPSKTDGTKVPAANITRSKIKYTTASGTSNSGAYMTQVVTGKRSAYLLDLGTESGNVGTQTIISTGALLKGLSSADSKVQSLATDAWGANNITWYALLQALATDKGLDILQDRLKSAQKSLIRSNAAGTGSYLEFGPASSPLRLYISNNEPEVTDVPVGSIGIGWGFDIES